MKDVRFQRQPGFVNAACSLRDAKTARQTAARYTPRAARWQKHRQPVGDLEQWGQRAYKCRISCQKDCREQI